ncbi:MAG: ActR/PrrA/RegA family redox response regulator transcription factor [Candidatus Puniceispirillaceae bacterium]|jgi:two-component system response regulator RegA|nr:ActR/PrrA/RegA family redox response regulator transcription factor [Pseudomonadota bacterium]
MDYDSYDADVIRFNCRIMMEKTLLILDDDNALRRTLARSMEMRGFSVDMAATVAEARSLIDASAPSYAVLDLKLEDGNGLEIVTLLQSVNPSCRIVMLTGFGNIATAVAAVKAGALDYLPKPANPDEIERALIQIEGQPPQPPEDPMSADRVRWEHIQRVFEQCDRNVSETARRLKMHRRTLQRILAKHAPRG